MSILSSAEACIWWPDQSLLSLNSLKSFRGIINCGELLFGACLTTQTRGIYTPVKGLKVWLFLPRVCVKQETGLWRKSAVSVVRFGEPTHSYLAFLWQTIKWDIINRQGRLKKGWFFCWDCRNAIQTSTADMWQPVDGDLFVQVPHKAFKKKIYSVVWSILIHLWLGKRLYSSAMDWLPLSSPCFRSSWSYHCRFGFKLHLSMFALHIQGWGSACVSSLHILPVLLEYSDFLPQSKDMCSRLNCISKLSTVCDCTL